MHPLGRLGEAAAIDNGCEGSEKIEVESVAHSIFH
jgi:hypothetical protein